MQLLKWIGSIVLGGVSIAIALANTHTVEVHIPFQPDIALVLPLYILLLGSLILGIILCGLMGALHHMVTSYHQQRRIRHLEKELHLQEQENTSLVKT